MAEFIRIYKSFGSDRPPIPIEFMCLPTGDDPSCKREMLVYCWAIVYDAGTHQTKIWGPYFVPQDASVAAGYEELSVTL